MDKEQALLAWLKEQKKVAVAFSGGVDSSLLAAAAQRALGGNAVALTLDTVLVPQREKAQAARLAAQVGIRHIALSVDVLSLAQVVENAPRRCYHCKKALFSRLKEEAARLGFAILCDGTNTDDAGDYRPGMQAARELGIASPLAACGFSKADIRALSRKYGLCTAQLPSFACLASRIPYGTPLTRAALARVERAEDALQRLQLWPARVRAHGDVARIELAPDMLARAVQPQVRQAVSSAVKEAGFAFVALDLEGYRTGSLNVHVKEERSDV
nr:ATP-dependent sacrificial sulfur transferase LarE [Maliibacterium massiliense]